GNESFCTIREDNGSKFDNFISEKTVKKVKKKIDNLLSLYA
ncbi:10915_t:CDS:1, partial [Cetraspora pellucida]